MKKAAIIIALMATVLAGSTASACPTMLSYGYCTCGMCGTGNVSGCGYYDRTGEGYYDSMGHYCEYGGYWEDGCWVQTVGYYEGGEWCPAQYDPMLDIGYYDEAGNYHLYGGTAGCGYFTETCWDYAEPCQGYVYDEYDTWAADDLGWIEAQDCGYQDYSYEDCGYTDCWIDVDMDADVISIVNNGVIIYSGTCSCAGIYQGQEFSFSDQRCAGIWNQCSAGFYDTACGYPVDRVCCR